MLLICCRFDENNYDSHAYFLSHCHTDHMTGLNDLAFHSRLHQRDGVFLYASPVSVEILKNLRPAVTKKLKPLPLEVPTLVPVKDKFVCVTLVRAGHCPGSVMFLFEYEGRVILYTGDYRIHKNDIKKFKTLKYRSGTPKPIHKIYLDTTFFFKKYISFPLRDHWIEEVCSMIREWIARSAHHIVNLITSARYGYEDLFIELSKQLSLPIHVCEAEYKFYRCVPEMDKAVTLSADSTPLHSNCGVGFKAVCKLNYPAGLIKRIQFSAMTWTEQELAEKGGISHDPDCTRVCYATHASLEEGQALLRTLKPHAVEPCVVPDDKEKREELMELIEETIREYKQGSNRNLAVPEAKTKLFVVKEDDVCSETNQNVQTQEMCSLLDSPPRNTKKRKERS